MEWEGLGLGKGMQTTCKRLLLWKEAALVECSVLRVQDGVF